MFPGNIRADDVTQVKSLRGHQREKLSSTAECVGAETLLHSSMFSTAPSDTRKNCSVSSFSFTVLSACSLKTERHWCPNTFLQSVKHKILHFQQSHNIFSAPHFSALFPSGVFSFDLCLCFVSLCCFVILLWMRHFYYVFITQELPSFLFRGLLSQSSTSI